MMLCGLAIPIMSLWFYIGGSFMSGWGIKGIF